MTKFSVVIPTLRRRKALLHNAMESVLKQTLPPAEIVIVGADYLPELENYRNKNGKVVLRAIDSPRRLNASESRNLGAKIASCEWLTFLDDDDFWDSNYLQLISDTIEGSGTHAVLGELHLRNLNGEFKRISRHFKAQDLYLGNPGVTGSNLTVRKDVFDVLGGFSSKLTVSQDKAFMLELLKRNYTLSFAEDAIAFNCEHPLPRLTDANSQLRGHFEFYRIYRGEMSIITQVQFLRKALSIWRANARNFWKFPFT